MKIAVIPIDNRPVCYNLIDEIASIDDDLELFLPDKKLLGGLRSAANVEEILAWLDKLEQIDALVISLDTIAYGGLISSRRCKNSLDEVKLKLEKLKNECFSKFKGKIYAFSSILRISNNNINEEEKEYWSEFGEKIFEYSYTFHKEGIETTDIPDEILNDYLATRHRNFEINKIYIEWLNEGIFNTLVFSKDDCAEYGLNVLEAEILKKIIKEKNLSAIIKTGADELPLTLFSKAVCDYNKKAPKISTKFLAPEDIYPCRVLISNYEDISIENSIFSQLNLIGCEIAEENKADLILIVNNFEEKQGEIVMGITTKPFSGKLELPEKPFMIADVRFANGADNKFVEKLLKKIEKINFNNFYGYSAWNTSANTLGSLICAGIVRFFAKKFNETAFKNLQMIRFLDDWAYQANVRQELKQKAKSKKQNVNKIESENRPDVRKLQKLMLPYEKRMSKIFGIQPNVKYKFPWKRFFEVEVIIK